MQKFVQALSRRRSLLVNGVIVGFSAILVACGGGGGGSSSSTSGGTVQGNVAQLSTMQIEAPIPMQDRSLVAQLGAAFGIEAASAQSGNVGGCRVTVAGLTDTTDNAGRFRITNVPAGQRVMTVDCNGVRGSATVPVAAGGTTTLSNIVVRGGSANPSRTVVDGGDDNSNSGDDGNTNTDDGNTNTDDGNTNTDDGNTNDDDGDDDDDDDDDNNTNDDDDDDDDDDNSNDD